MALELAPDIDGLRASLRGEVFLPGEPGFVDNVGGFNLLSPTSPELVVVVADEADVQTTVRWAVANGQTVHPQLTGHGAYRTLDHGILLKTQRLNGLTVDADAATFTIGAGLRWIDVVPELHRHGLGAVTGSAKTVGAVGLLLGGGIGPLGRSLGMASDWIRSIRVVDGRGDVLVASPVENEDLFWALRGGKVGLGVVTEMTIAAPRMPHVYGGGLFYAAADIARVAHEWADWIEDVPESMNTSIAILRLPPEVPPPLGGAPVLHVRFAYVEVGLSDEELISAGEAALTRWRARAGAPILDTVGLLPSDRIAEIHAEPEGPLPVWEWGDFIDRIDHELVDVLLLHSGGDCASPLVTVEVRMLGGAIARPGEHPDAVGGRSQPFSVLVLGVPDDAAAPWAVVEAAGHTIRDALVGYSGPEVNYNWANHPSAETFRSRLWPAATARRLAEIRARRDPHGVFEHGN